MKNKQKIIWSSHWHDKDRNRVGLGDTPAFICENCLSVLHFKSIRLSLGADIENLPFLGDVSFGLTSTSVTHHGDITNLLRPQHRCHFSDEKHDMFQCDGRLVNTIRLMNVKGWTTYECCSGHVGDSHIYPHICFKCDTQDKKDMVGQTLAKLIEFNENPFKNEPTSNSFMSYHLYNGSLQDTKYDWMTCKSLYPAGSDDIYHISADVERLFSFFDEVSDVINVACANMEQFALFLPTLEDELSVKNRERFVCTEEQLTKILIGESFNKL